MSGKYLLDTNIVIALFANDSAVVSEIAKAQDISIPATVIGELFYGANKSGRPQDNSQRIDEFVSDNVIIHCDGETARFYGKIKNDLRKKGHPIPENDIWIAAAAFQHNLTLISRDKHFAEIDGLSLARW